MNQNPKYSVTVSVRSAYLAEQSAPDDGRYLFSYTVTLHNTGSIGAQLISRHWVITDGDGQEQQVRGLGVVGEQPQLQPGEQYQYTSGTLIPTPVGVMHGSYQMTADDGTRFDADIPSFTLSVPRTLH